MQEVFGRDLSKQSSGKMPDALFSGIWFYSLFNVLFLMGYNPQTGYDTRHQEILITPDEEYAAYIMEQILPECERSDENAAKILFWLKSHADADGNLLEIADSSYGTILWDIRDKTERPDYRAMVQGE